MKVLMVNTSEHTGGAAVAASRLCDALYNYGVKVQMLVRDKEAPSDAPSRDVAVLTPGKTLVPKWHFLWERLRIFWHLHLKRDHLFDIDIANSGFDITRLPAFKEADVIHLHWVNQGMLSLRGIRKILQSGKPVVWTMHDIWPATAICHLTLGCRRFTSGCQSCKYLPGGGSKNDLSASVWSRKQRMLLHQTVIFVACSRWLEGEAKASALLKGQTVTSIPNPIDTKVFCPSKRETKKSEKIKSLALPPEISDKLPEEGNIILFVCQRVSNPYKGMNYLIEACKKLAKQQPEMKSNTTLVVLGSHADDVAEQMPFPTVALGYVDDEHRMADIYRAADLFVLPSLSENLPNTIMEAMACGTPCVGFRVGGIPEEIDHKKNGYVAVYRDSDDLAEGIRWILFEADRQQLSDDAVRKVTRYWSQTSVAIRYSEIYQQAIAQKHFKL